MKNWQELAAICRTCNCSVQYAEPLRNHTTFRIGGACSAFVNVNSEETLRQILGLCRDRNYPYLVLGNGSNILAADSGYAGVILHLGKEFSQIRQDGTTLYCEAGATLGRIGKFALEESLTGMECLAGIPGTVGGALYMNAGAYGGEMADVIVSARCMAPDGTISVVPNLKWNWATGKVFSGRTAESFWVSRFSCKRAAMGRSKRKWTLCWESGGQNSRWSCPVPAAPFKDRWAIMPHF